MVRIGLRDTWEKEENENSFVREVGCPRQWTNSVIPSARNHVMGHHLQAAYVEQDAESFVMTPTRASVGVTAIIVI
jgi:hypothetical protein